MIPALLIWLFKRYGKPFIAKHPLLFSRLALTAKKLSLTFILVAVGLLTYAQERTLNYKVLHNGHTVGRMQLLEHTEGNDTFLKVASDVNIRFIFSVKVNIREDSHYRDGTLVCSHVWRAVNGRQKADKYTRANGTNYQLTGDGETRSINRAEITNNLTLMYLEEPVGLSQIYSDNFQQFVPIKQTGSHTYRINLPDGNYNFYTYKDGVCSRVDIHHSLYTIQIQLT
ncbi:MAG TPA: DUF6134 family protein [Mucilaginibacter sp.]|nr:DUF6134 family protein [Mucilaginibacter sp.]